MRVQRLQHVGTQAIHVDMQLVLRAPCGEFNARLATLRGSGCRKACSVWLRACQAAAK